MDDPVDDRELDAREDAYLASLTTADAEFGKGWFSFACQCSHA